MRGRGLGLACLLVLAAVSAPASAGPAKTLDETQEGDQAGVVYSLSHQGWITFDETSEICMRFHPGAAWTDASFSILLSSPQLVVTILGVAVSTGNAAEIRVIVDTQGVGGPQVETGIFEFSQATTTGACIGFDRLPATGGFGPGETTLVVGAPEAIWSSVDVTLESSKTFDWASSTIPKGTGLWATDTHMSARGSDPGANVQAGPVQASVLWGTTGTVPSGSLGLAIAGPMPFSAAEGQWSIDGPPGWSASWSMVPASPIINVNGNSLGTLLMWDAPAGSYAFSYDAVSVGAWPGFYAHLLPYDPPAAPPAP